MGYPSFSIVVPIVPKHHRHALRLVQNLMSGAIKPLEIIFAGSSQTENSKQELVSLSQLYPDLIRLHLSIEKYTAGQNRNRGWDIARGDYISFCDADDLYSPSRLEVLKEEINETNADLLLHDYLYQTPFLFIKKEPGNYRGFDTEMLFESTFPNGKRDRVLEFGVSGESNILFPSLDKKKHRIQHGHATVRNSVPLRYSDFPYAEDGIFCRDVLFARYRVRYISAKLSIYETFNLRNLFTNSRLRIIAELSRVKKKLLGLI